MGAPTPGAATSRTFSLSYIPHILRQFIKIVVSVSPHLWLQKLVVQVSRSAVAPDFRVALPSQSSDGFSFCSFPVKMGDTASKFFSCQNWNWKPGTSVFHKFSPKLHIYLYKEHSFTRDSDQLVNAYRTLEILNSVLHDSWLKTLQMFIQTQKGRVRTL